MKKILLILLPVAFGATAFCQSDVTGDWLGSLNVGADVRLVFHVTKTAQGFAAKMDSPDQGAKGIEISQMSVSGDSLHMKVELIKGGYDGLITSDTTIEGTWSQGPAKLPLSLKKTNEAPQLNRPQTPKPPFDYNSKDVEYDNVDKTVHLGATLTYPKREGKFPAAILITGSGQEDRDESIFEHKPFAVIADYLTRLGFAVLRIDDRGKGKSKGDVRNATSADFANDVETSLAFLKQQPQIDANRIGLIGHSEGGLIAALVDSRRKDISFMVMLAGPGESGAALLAAQNGAVLRSQHVDSNIAKSYEALYLQITNQISVSKDTTEAFTNAWKTYGNWQKANGSNTLTQLGITNETAARQMVKDLANGLSTPWMKYFLRSNAALLLEKTKAKVLALNGEKDIQVIAKTNLQGIENALKKSKSKSYKTQMLPGLNHLFQHCTSCTVMEYGKLEETFSPEALQIIGDWLIKEVIGSGNH